MAFSRKTMVASVAGSLSLAMLTGCPAANPAGGTTPSASPSTGATATPAPGGSASTNPSATPSTTASGSAMPSGSPSVTSSAPPPTGKTTIVSGTVYDDAGAPVDGAVITVKSLDTSVPYTATATTSQGSWVVNSVPEGANVEIVGTKDGWTSRRRVGSFQTNANVKNTIDFGGATANTADPSGVAYFISKYPEIASVDPAVDNDQVDHSAVSYKITLSEPLDDTNQTRFGNAIRLLPANTQADPNNMGHTDLRDAKTVEPLVTTGAANPVSNYAYQVKRGTQFLGDSSTGATVSWDATGTVATLTFNAPLIADDKDVARYQVALAPASSDRIVDKDNNQLGLDFHGSRTAYDGTDDIIHSTVKMPDLSLDLGSVAATSSSRWAATHLDAARFGVKVDTDAPQLVSTTYTKGNGTGAGSSARIELTFNEPLADFDGSQGGFVDSSLTATLGAGNILDTLSFTVSDKTGGTKNTDLKGTTASTGNNNNLQSLAVATTAYNKKDVEFKIAEDAGQSALVTYGTKDIKVAETDATTAGSILLQVNPSNPKTLFIYFVKVNNIFATTTTPNLVELKARVEGVTDPAGNSISSTDADKYEDQGLGIASIQ